MVLRVEAVIVGWFGMVRKSEPPARFGQGHRRETWPSGWNGCFRDERLQERRIVRQDFGAKRLDVKPDGGFDIGEGFLVAAAFAHHDPFRPRG